MLTQNQYPLRQIRSYVCRNSRMAKSVRTAYHLLWPAYGILPISILDYEALFKRQAKTVIEIGFGFGQSLLALAKANPHYNYLGIETHRPGIGALLKEIHENKISNLRILEGDAITILKEYISPESLAGIQLFFPDPWPKRRHHIRRIIQPSFLSLVCAKLKQGGYFHVATDWEDYAMHMVKVFHLQEELVNTVADPFASRSPHRPVITKFEARALKEKRRIFDFQFAKK